MSKTRSVMFWVSPEYHDVVLLSKVRPVATKDDDTLISYWSSTDSEELELCVKRMKPLLGSIPTKPTRYRFTATKVR